jgi:hypothetical protein
MLYVALTLLEPLRCEDGGGIQEGQTPTAGPMSAHFQLTVT